MYSISRIIEPNAKFIYPAHSGASAAKRCKDADNLMDRFYSQVMPEFEKKGYITKKKLQEVYKNILPNINLNFPKMTKEDKAGTQASIKAVSRREMNKVIVSGYDIKFPFIIKGFKKVLKQDKAEGLFHETSHLFDFVTNPKNKLKLTFSYQTIINSDKYLAFTDDMMYPGRVLKEKLKPEDDLKTVFKEELAKLFEETGADSYEKIEMYQNFRHEIKTEQRAFPKGYTYKGDFESLDYVKKIKEHKDATPEKKESILKDLFNERKEAIRVDYNNYLEETYGLNTKLEVIEELLKEELKAVRAKHSEIYPTARLDA